MNNVNKFRNGSKVLLLRNLLKLFFFKFSEYEIISVFRVINFYIQFHRSFHSITFILTANIIIHKILLVCARNINRV